MRCDKGTRGDRDRDGRPIRYSETVTGPLCVGRPPASETETGDTVRETDRGRATISAHQPVVLRDSVEKHVRVLCIMTTFSDDETDKLIELITQYPALYDTQLDFYKDDKWRDNVWKIIAEGVNKSGIHFRFTYFTNR